MKHKTPRNNEIVVAHLCPPGPPRCLVEQHHAFSSTLHLTIAPVNDAYCRRPA